MPRPIPQPTIAILKEQEAGLGSPICAASTGSAVPPRRLRALEDENARLKKLLAEAMLDRAA